MRPGHRNGIALILAVAIAISGCAAVVTGGPEESRLAHLQERSEVVAVHYQRPAPFLVARPRSVGRAMALAAALAPLALLAGPLAPAMGNVLQADIERRAAEAAGRQLMLEIPLEDPAVRVKDRLISRLSADGRIGPIRPAAAAMDSDDLKSLKQALGPVTVLDVRTTSWGLFLYQVDPRTFLVHYTVKARLIRLDQEKVLWRDEIHCYDPGDRRFGAPVLEDLKADGGALLKTTMARTAESCVDPLLARFRGEKPTRPLPGPDEPARVVLDPATLAQAEDALFGPSGLVEGSRRFKAKFQGLTLAAQDLPTLRAMMQRASASPWRSEVQFRGTLGGVAFKAEVEKGSVGRTEFTLEGLQFDDEGQAAAFLAPLQGRGVQEVKLVGIAGGRPITIVLTPSSTSPAQPTATAVTPTATSPAVVASAAPAWLAEPKTELMWTIGTWTGTLAGPPRSPSDLGVRQDVTLRIFEQDGVIRWESSRRFSGREVWRGAGAVILSNDGIVLSGQRQDAGSSTSVGVTLPLTRRGRTLEASLLSRDNVVYTISLTRGR
jgi:hypothetical protein